jgi:FMN phosphatase YigB (HAD superfamily)
MPSGRIKAAAVDFGGSISGAQVDHLLGQKRVDPAAAAALHALSALDIRLILASNTLPCETRWPALRKAAIDGLFCVALLSDPLGVRKPDPLFYRLVLAAAESPPEQVLFVGDHLGNDVAAPITHGMRAALIRPHGLRADETLPDGALLIRHIRDLPALLETV